jgi:hypothetical protein
MARSHRLILAMALMFVNDTGSTNVLFFFKSKEIIARLLVLVSPYEQWRSLSQNGPALGKWFRRKKKVCNSPKAAKRRYTKWLNANDVGTPRTSGCHGILSSFVSANQNPSIFWRLSILTKPSSKIIESNAKPTRTSKTRPWPLFLEGMRRENCSHHHYTLQNIPAIATIVPHRSQSKGKTFWRLGVISIYCPQPADNSCSQSIHCCFDSCACWESK